MKPEPSPQDSPLDFSVTQANKFPLLLKPFKWSFLLHTWDCQSSCTWLLIEQEIKCKLLTWPPKPSWFGPGHISNLVPCHSAACPLLLRQPGFLEQTTLPPTSVFSHMLSLYTLVQTLYITVFLSSRPWSQHHMRVHSSLESYSILDAASAVWISATPWEKNWEKARLWVGNILGAPSQYAFGLSTLTSEKNIINKCVGTSYFSGVRMENFIPKNAKRLLVMRQKLDYTASYVGSRKPCARSWCNRIWGEGESSRGQQVRRRLERDYRVHRASRIFSTEGRVKRTLRIFSWTATHGVLVSSLKNIPRKTKNWFPGRKGKWRVTACWLQFLFR